MVFAVDDSIIYIKVKKVVSNAEKKDMLRKWHGADALIWMFDPIACRLCLKLHKSLNVEGCLYLLCASCVHIVTPFWWFECNIEILDEDQFCRVVDPKSGFILLCSSVSMYLGADSEMVVSFDDFKPEN